MLYPQALQRLLPENASSRRITPRVFVVHSIVGSGSSAYGYFLRGTSLESTFIVPRSDEANGDRVWQLMDSERQADAQRDANRFAISAETGDRGQPDTQPWDAGQVKRIIELGIWVVNHHRAVRRVRCTAWDGSGIGYHSMWGAPSHWTPARGKTCPGRARIAQFERVILPSILAEAPPGTTYDPPESAMTLTAAQAAQLDEAAKGVARIEAAIAKLGAKAAAVRTTDGPQMWLVSPAGRWKIDRPALNMLVISGLAVEYPTPVHPSYLAAIPVVKPS